MVVHACLSERKQEDKGLIESPLKLAQRHEGTLRGRAGSCGESISLPVSKRIAHELTLQVRHSLWLVRLKLYIKFQGKLAEDG